MANPVLMRTALTLTVSSAMQVDQDATSVNQDLKRIPTTVVTLHHVVFQIVWSVKIAFVRSALLDIKSIVIKINVTLHVQISIA